MKYGTNSNLKLLHETTNTPLITTNITNTTTPFSPPAVTVGFGAELYEFPEDAISGETIITVLITEGELRRPVTVTLSLADITTVGELTG